MSDRDMNIRITASDQASDDMQRVAQNARRMGQEIDRAADEAQRGFRGVGTAVKEFSDKLDEVGTAVGIVVGGLALLGSNAREHERQVQAIQVAYGDAANEILDFSEAIQDATNFSNDAAREAALVAATLTRQYGLTTDQAQELVARAADLAAVFGVSLQDATERLSGAVRGEAEAAERLGVAVSASTVEAYAAARGYDNWNTITDESIKGAVRFQAIMDQTTYSIGAAANQAQGAAGAGAAFRDWLDDTGEAAGRALGPVGEFLSVSGNLALALPLVGNAMGRLAQGAISLGGALGPLGLVAAAGAGALAIYQLIRANDEAKLSMGEVEGATDDLIAVINRLQQTGATAEVLTGVRQGVEFLQEIGRASNEAAGRLAGVTDELTRQRAALADLEQGLIFAQSEAAGQAILAEIEAQRQLVAQLEAQQAALEQLILTEDQFNQARDATIEILSDMSRVNYPELIAEVQRLQVEFARTGDADAYVAGLIALAGAVESFGVSLDSLAPKVADVTTKIGFASDEIGGFAVGVGYATTQVAAYTQVAGNATGATDELGGSASGAAEAIGAGGSAAQDALTPMRVLIGAWNNLGDALDANAAHQQEVNDGLAEAERRNSEAAASVQTNADAARQYREETQRQTEASRAAAEAERERVAALVAGGNAQIAAGYQATADAAAAAADATRQQVDAGRAQAATLEDQIAAMDSYTFGAYAAADGTLTLAEQMSFLTRQGDEFSVQIGEIGGQIGTTNSALKDMEEAYEILNERRWAGQQLSEAELDFLARYDERVATATGNLADWEVQQGLVAGSMLDNIEAQEGLTETMGDTNEAILTLVDTLRELFDLDPRQGSLFSGLGELVGLIEAATTRGQLPGPGSLSGTHGYEVVEVDGRFVSRPSGEGAVVSPTYPAGPANQPPPPQTLLITVEAETAQAEADLDAVQQRAEFVVDGPGREGWTIVMHTDGDEAYAVLYDLDGDIEAVVTKDRTILIDGDPSAFWATVRALDGRYVGASYIELVGVPGRGFTGLERQYGGVVEAQYGRLIRAGEVGPEWIDYPSGGGVLAARDGAYVVPQGSFVHTAGATRGMGGGGVTVNVGPFYGVSRQDGAMIRREVESSVTRAFTAFGR